MYTADGSQELLRNKLARNNVGNDLIEGFVKLIDLHKLPDIAMAVAKSSSLISISNSSVRTYLVALLPINFGLKRKKSAFRPRRFAYFDP